MSDFVFVGGAGHSGTSLITAMLGAHPKIYSIPIETYAFRRDLPENEIRRKLETLARACDKPDVSYICEKSPSHIRKCSQIAAVYPTAKFVLIIRDPRDVVASFRRRGVSLDGAIRNWSLAYKSLLRARMHQDVCSLHFESLVERPENELSRVCAYLGLDYHPSMLDYWKDPRGWQGVTELRKPQTVQGADHRLYRNWQVHQPLMKDRVGSFENLTPDELDQVENELSSLAAEIGYRIEPGRPDRPGVTFGL